MHSLAHLVCNLLSALLMIESVHPQIVCDVHVDLVEALGHEIWIVLGHDLPEYLAYCRIFLKIWFDKNQFWTEL